MNEEDIKILERMLKIEKECLHYDVSQDEIQAIKNLINRNKELEEFIVKYYDEIRKEYEGLINHKLIDYIPKSKIKEKIEELEEKGESDLRTYGFAVETHLAKQVLQELLEE